MESIAALAERKHTPGPWLIWRDYNVMGADGRRGIASTGGFSDSRRPEDAHAENEANARLIAAAPDLLDACKEFVRKVEAGEARSTRSYQQMMAAIAKAEGRE